MRACVRVRGFWGGEVGFEGEAVSLRGFVHAFVHVGLCACVLTCVCFSICVFPCVCYPCVCSFMCVYFSLCVFPYVFFQMFFGVCVWGWVRARAPCVRLVAQSDCVRVFVCVCDCVCV